MQLETIPVHQLVPSPRNKRRTGGEDVTELVASIAAHGLAQNLCVERTPQADGTRTVIAGGRRLRALQQLVEAGTLPPDWPVPCRVVDDGRAAEVSIAENVVRVAMHPADEFQAFAELHEDGVGLSIAEIATRFGCAEQHVRRLLRLSTVSPTLMQAFRQDGIELDQMMALAITDDHAEQERVWNAAKHVHWMREPERLREALTAKELSPHKDPLAKYVGIEAYVTAGGPVRKDLFAPQDVAGEYLQDVQLVERLASEKLEKRAEQLRKEGWAWVEVRPTLSWEEKHKFREEPGTWQGRKQVWTDEQKQYCGAIVTVSREGKNEVHYGLVRPGDKKKAAAQGDSSGKAKAAAKPPTTLSLAAVQRLQGYRTGVTRAVLMDPARQNLALASLAATLWGDGALDTLVRIDAGNDWNTRPDAAVSEGIEAADAAYQLTEDEIARLRDSVDMGTSLLEWLLAQPLATTLRFLQVAAARYFLSAFKAQAQPYDVGRQFLEVAGIDMTDHWQVDEQWLASVQKRTVLAAVREACGKTAATRVEKLKGEELVKEAAKQLSAAGWLPEPLRHPKAKRSRDAKQKAAGDKA